ncbi:MAG: UDP-N-acetylglucosamine 1-carboxyvinyltransferase [Cyanobacteriota bacterium ELA615]|jgi:UDP-N-acetylglucosamine 1-carboxyvinyltransferase
MTPPSTIIEENQPILEIYGKSQLNGEVVISGAKNSALVIMAGALLCPEDCHLDNVPSLADIEKMIQILESLGLEITRKGQRLEINAKNITEVSAPYDLVSQMRASFFVIGPLLARMGVAHIPLPGGCAIGARPVDLHVRGLQAMGAEVIIEHGIARAYIKGNHKRLTGTKIYLDYPSVGATETLMMAATLAQGETILENAACEPEVIDLANFCIAMGAKIKGAGTSTIIISGVDSLHSVKYSIIPDRIEAGTFLVAGAITQSELSLYPIIPEHLASVIAKLEAIGPKVIIEDFNRLKILPAPLKATDIETLPFPGFPTDMQAQFMALLTLAEGNCVVTETVFENRMRHVAELQRMGANIRVKGNHAIIQGVPFLSGAPLMATDLRASAALVLAGLAAEGKTTIQCLQHLDRGYDDLEGKLQKVGAKLSRINGVAGVRVPS